MPKKKKTPAAKNKKSTAIAHAPTPPISDELRSLRAMHTQDERVDQIVRWMIAGNPPREIAETAAVAWPGEKFEGLELLALNKLIAAGETEVAVVKGFCAAAFREIYAKCLEVGDQSGAMSAVKNFARLFDVM